MRIVFYIIVCCFVFAGACFADTFIVDDDGSADYLSIQEAIDNSNDGDTIVVNPGIYREKISFNQLAITVTSTDPNDPNVVESTIINGSVTFNFREEADSVLKGLTIAGNYLMTNDLSSISTTPNAPSQRTPDVSGGVIVWEDGRDIYSYDYVEQSLLPICILSKNQIYPAVSGDYVIWQDNRVDAFNDIYGFNMKTNEEVAICTVAGMQAYAAIDGDIVVWMDTRNVVSDIYGYDLSSGDEFAVCTAVGSQDSPAVCGDIVVWRDIRIANDDNIYGYNLSSGAEFEVCTKSGIQFQPKVYGDIVVWLDMRNGENDIYGMHISTGEEFVICDANGLQEMPSIHGDLVVWQDERNYDAVAAPGNRWDIYAYDLVSGKEFAICTDDGNQERPVIDGNTLVWQDNRNGTVINYTILSSFFSLELDAVDDGIICNSAGPTISNNYFYGCNSNAIKCNIYATPVIEYNFISYNNIGVYGGMGRIEGNDIYRNLSYGISDCNALIVSNAINLNFGHGVNSCGGQIEDNEISDNFGDGLFDCTGVVSGNVITSNEGAGINQCVGEFTGNTITSNVAFGIFGCSGDISYNSITGNQGGVYYCQSRISGNNIVANTGDGISGGGTGEGNEVVDNVISLNGGDGVREFDSIVVNNLIAANMIGGLFDCNDVVNNTIVDNLGNGIDSCIGSIRNNIIAFNKDVGIYGPAANNFNCFWKNDGGSFYNDFAAPNDILRNPYFVDNGGWNDNETPDDSSDDIWSPGDYHLDSEYGRWDEVSGQWVIDDRTSRCIDAGDPADGTGYEINPNGGLINMGAFGGTALASKGSSDGEEPPDEPAKCIDPPSMDTNDDCKIDIVDFAVFASEWLMCGLDDLSACWDD